MSDKTYCEFMEEISSDDLYKGLLGYGLFADKLPPIFSSEEFYKFSLTISQPFASKWRNYVYFESTRQTNIPRPFGIPNPLGYQKLCKVLSDNWELIKQHFHNQTNNQGYRVSRIHIRKLHNSNSIFEMNYKNWRVDGSPEINNLIGAKYLVKSDISTCFPSIYTHAIPWAIATKTVAKKNTRNDDWYNKLDKCCQDIKNGETHGLIIGPHASNLIAELILTCVDKKMYDKGWKYTRNIDDFTCYVDSYEKAEKFIAELNETLREFDLPINFKKTSIEELPKASTNHWVRQLNGALSIDNNELLKFPIARSYLDTAIALMEQNQKDASILKYAIKVLGKKNLSSNAKNYCLKTIEHYAIIYPYLITLMDDYVFSPFGASLDEIENFSNLIYSYAPKTNNYELMYYALFFAIKYNLNIKNIDIEYILRSSSCLLKLFAWIYFKQKGDNMNETRIYNFAVSIKDTDFDENWLFCYEVLKANDLQDEWLVLKRNNISFINNEYQF